MLFVSCSCLLIVVWRSLFVVCVCFLFCDLSFVICSVLLVNLRVRLVLCYSSSVIFCTLNFVIRHVFLVLCYLMLLCCVLLFVVDVLMCCLFVVC